MIKFNFDRYYNDKPYTFTALCNLSTAIDRYKMFVKDGVKVTHYSEQPKQLLIDLLYKFYCYKLCLAEESNSPEERIQRYAYLREYYSRQGGKSIIDMYYERLEGKVPYKLN